MGFIKYIGGGSGNSPDMTVATSVNNGTSWNSKVLKKGQTFPIGNNVTNVQINGVPYDPKRSYTIRDGHVTQDR